MNYKNIEININFNEININFNYKNIVRYIS